MRFLFLFLAIGFQACGQSEMKKYVPDPRAKKLADSAVSIMMNFGDYERGIALLDQATQIDSNYFSAYSNKLSFQLMLRKYETALITAKNMNRIKPEAPDFYVTVGILSEKTGDTISSQGYFRNAAVHYDKILDTMKEENKSYTALLMGKAVNLLLIGDKEKGNKILKQLYEKPFGTSEFEEMYKKEIRSFMDKSQKEIVDELLHPKTDETSVMPNRIP